MIVLSLVSSVGVHTNGDVTIEVVQRTKNAKHNGRVAVSQLVQHVFLCILQQLFTCLRSVVMADMTTTVRFGNNITPYGQFQGIAQKQKRAWSGEICNRLNMVRESG
jgi:hypothetical protein